MSKVIKTCVISHKKLEYEYILNFMDDTYVYSSEGTRSFHIFYIIKNSAWAIPYSGIEKFFRIKNYKLL